MGGQSVLRAIKAVANSSNTHKNVTTHSLRHCYATHLISEGLNLHVIQKRLDHESALATAIYTQLTDSTHQNSAAIIDAMLQKLWINLGWAGVIMSLTSIIRHYRDDYDQR